MNQYIVTVKHDTGTARLHVAANTITQAIRLVMNTEKCPESAITGAKQVRP